MHASYLVARRPGPGDPFEKVPELSRRARGVPVWAALRSLGRSTASPTWSTGSPGTPARSPTGIATIDGAEVLNDVVFTQVCASFGDDARTRAVTARLLADGTTWMSGSRWRDRACCGSR